VVVTNDAVLIDFVGAHGSEPLDQLTLNMGRNSNLSQAPVDFTPLASLKSVQTLSLSGFTVKTMSPGLNSQVTVSPGLTDEQVRSIAGIRTLRWLELRSLTLTDPQKRILRSELPKCEILEK
jgi:hypothetical protein